MKYNTSGTLGLTASVSLPFWFDKEELLQQWDFPPFISVTLSDVKLARHVFFFYDSSKSSFLGLCLSLITSRSVI